MTPFFDLHTHLFTQSEETPISIISTADPTAIVSEDQLYYSLEIHPWVQTTLLTKEQIDRSMEVLNNPRIIAIGECGLDRLKGANLELQTAILEQIITLSETKNKPLILHVVRCWNEIMTLHRQNRPTQPWIIHGFRGHPLLAQQLIDQGFYLSLADTFRSDTAAIIPSDHLFIESDTRQQTLEQTYKAIAQVRNVDTEDLARQIAVNMGKLFPIG